jgi:hypothetical protein
LQENYRAHRGEKLRIFELRLVTSKSSRNACFTHGGDEYWEFEDCLVLTAKRYRKYELRVCAFRPGDASPRPMTPPARSRLSVFVLLATLAAAGPAAALPRIGAPALALDARIQDVDGRVLRLRSFAGKPTLIIHEDKHSAQQNHVLKDELIRLAQENRWARDSFQFVGIADVSEYDYWPVRAIAARRVRERAQAVGAPIYPDFKGIVRKALGLHRGQSSIVLVGKDGRVRFAAEGRLRDDQRAQLFEMLREELRGLARGLRNVGIDPSR